MLTLNGICFADPFVARLFCVLTAYLPGGICIFLFWKRGTSEIANTLAQALRPIALLCFLPLVAVLAEMFLAGTVFDFTPEPWQPEGQACQLKIGSSRIIAIQFDSHAGAVYRIDHIGLGLQSRIQLLLPSLCMR